MKVFILEHLVNGVSIRWNEKRESGMLSGACRDNGFTVGTAEVQMLCVDIICSLEIQVCSLRKRSGLKIQM